MTRPWVYAILNECPWVCTYTSNDGARHKQRLTTWLRFSQTDRRVELGRQFVWLLYCASMGSFYPSRVDPRPLFHLLFAVPRNTKTGWSTRKRSWWWIQERRGRAETPRGQEECLCSQIWSKSFLWNVLQNPLMRHVCMWQSWRTARNHQIIGIVTHASSLVMH